ncbi:MAG: cytoplasmic iron level regulating protein YaaA (DUF328/UPF0246 family) [Saprospiraceae bacterium]|jgi:cytoplasmic iron level regulating protein YaaA (DUF328/UPF0246 family)
MLLLISPAKTLDFSATANENFTQPRFMAEIKELANILKKKSAEDLKELMHISDKLAQLNSMRYQEFKTPFDRKNSKQSILAFKGDVYTGLNVDDFTKGDLEFSQQCLRILSGLYGLLRPMDLMQPYRLEMGTKLENNKGRNLYEFWGDKITKILNNDLATKDNELVINLASKEYFKSVQIDKLKGKLYNVHFKEEREGKLKIIAFNAKKARGMMCRYIIKNRIETAESMKSFAEDNYLFNDELSTETEYFFTR